MGRAVRRVVFAAVAAAWFMVSLPATAGERSGPIRLPFGTAPAMTVVVVEPGDHLWKISDLYLSGRLGREALDREVSPYWRVVIEVNRDDLRSGDPDLIYPGEIVTLPPVP